MPCEGTYFQVASYAAISNENDVDFANDLLRNMAWLQFLFLLFYADGKDKLIRFCFKKTTLEEAAKRLCHLKSVLKFILLCVHTI
jgi:methionine aminotransferase